VQRPRMRFVPIKTEERLDLQALHWVRERWVMRRTAVVNQIRSLLLEPLSPTEDLLCAAFLCPKPRLTRARFVSPALAVGRLEDQKAKPTWPPSGIILNCVHNRSHLLCKSLA
jgi:transposase